MRQTLWYWQSGQSGQSGQIPIIFSCIFHFYHLFHAHLFFFHYKLLHPSFFSLIKSTVCLISTVVIAHFYHLYTLFFLFKKSTVCSTFIMGAKLFFCVFFWQIYRSSNFHHFFTYFSLLPFISCTFFFFFFIANFYTYFFSLIKSTVCPITKVVIDHF